MKKILDKSKFWKKCNKCKKFDSADNSENHIPQNCITYLGVNLSKCRRRKKIASILKQYFKEENNSVDIYNKIEEMKVDVEEYIFYDSEFSYYSIRIPICSIEEEITRSKEIWRCKSIDEAEEVRDSLNMFNYYWIPISTRGKVFIEKIYL